MRKNFVADLAEPGKRPVTKTPYKVLYDGQSWWKGMGTSTHCGPTSLTSPA